MTLEGILEPERLRDWLYSKMRGARSEEEGDGAGEDATEDEALALLREIRDVLRGGGAA